MPAPQGNQNEAAPAPPKGSGEMYLSPDYRGLGLPERGIDVLASGEVGPFVVRGATVVGLRRDSSTGTIRFTFDGHGSEVAVLARRRMRFGDERGMEWVTALDYARRVVERGDELDLVVSPEQAVPTLAFWIRIVREGAPRPGQRYRLKEAGLFAMRAKAGEKAERWAARKLAQAGHAFPAEALASPGHFRIRFAGKRDRKPDLTCGRCGLRFEVKKRNRDMLFRVSHSEARPFSTEHGRLGWHAFVFPDLSVHYVASARILEILSAGRFKPGRDEYDDWADLDSADVLSTEEPPPCSGAQPCGWSG